MQKREEQFLDSLYLGVRDRAGFDASLSILSELFDVASAILLDYDAARPEVSAQASVGVFSGDNLKVYQQDFAAIDPAPAAFMARPVGTAIPTYRLLPQETNKPSAFFGEFFRPLGLEECLGGTLASARGRFAMIGLQRAPDRHRFEDEDVQRLERLMPHLTRALQLRRDFVKLEGVTGALSQLCDRLAAGVAAFDQQGHLLFLNESARAIARLGDGLSVDRTGKPFASQRVANARLTQLEMDVRQGGAGGVARVPRPGGRPAYAVRIAPFFVQEGIEAHARPPARGVLFIIHDPAMRSPSASEIIGAAFGLTPGTSQLVEALVAGEELADYAARAGITMNTVRYHLKVIYARMGLTGQGELMKKAAAVLRDLADHGSDGKD